MSAPSRRAFIARTTAVLSATRATFAREPLKSSNLGVQLYTVRTIIGKDPAATLRAIQDIGYTEVEFTFGNLDQVWPALQQTKLKPVSIHVDSGIFTGDTNRLDSTLSDLKRRGFEYVVIPFYQIAQGGAEGVKRSAEMMNKAGERANANGLRLCYHNHAHDLQPVDGTPALALLMNETQRNLVALEIDIFWASVAGHDPAKLIKTYSGRVPLLHLKDKARGIPVQYNERVAASAFKEVGSGSINIPAVLSAADEAGVRHYFVEQDQTPGDPIASLRQSYKYLSSQFKD